MGETLFDTSAQSIMPSLVDKERLSEANGRLYGVELTMNQFVGPPLGGVLAAVTVALAFAGSAAAYLLAALALVAMRGSFRPGRTGPPTRLRTDVVEGLRFLWRNRVLRTLGMMTGGFNLASSAMTAVFVLYAVRPGPMGLSESGFGLLLTAAAVGAVLGSRVAAPVERALGRNRVLGLAAVTGAVFNGMPAVTDMVAPMVAASVVGGAGVVLYNVVAVSLRQRITPDRLLGRVNAGYRLLAWGTMPVGAALGGLSAETLGLRPTFALTAVVALALLAGTLVVTDDAIAAAEHDAEREAMTADR
jgi:predicted MFS family arabinose efflux permease